MNIKYILDANMVGQLLRAHPRVIELVTSALTESLCISAVTEGGLAFGLDKCPDATKLAKTVGEFLQRIEVCAWDSGLAQTYGVLRAEIEKDGLRLARLHLRLECAVCRKRASP